MRHIHLPRPSLRAAVTLFALTAAMVLLNFALPQREPAAFLLLWAAYTVLHAYAAASVAYLAASAVFLSWQAFACCLAQTALLLLAFGLCRRFSKTPGA